MKLRSRFKNQISLRVTSADFWKSVEILNDRGIALSHIIREDDLTGARQALAEGADLCDRMREGMNHLLKTEDFTELEAALRAADGHLEWNAPEEAFGELRRAQVQVETLAWLARRIL